MKYFSPFNCSLFSPKTKTKLSFSPGTMLTLVSAMVFDKIISTNSFLLFQLTSYLNSKILFIVILKGNLSEFFPGPLSCWYDCLPFESQGDSQGISVGGSTKSPATFPSLEDIP